MKKGGDVFRFVQQFIAGVIVIILFSSCDFYNFSQPQPYDQKNLYLFPDCFIGKWLESDTFTTDFEFTVPLNQKSGVQAATNAIRFHQTSPSQDDGEQGYYINKKYVLILIKQEQKLVKEAWPKYQPGKGYSHLPVNIYSFQKIQ